MYGRAHDITFCLESKASRAASANKVLPKVMAHNTKADAIVGP